MLASSFTLPRSLTFAANQARQRKPKRVYTSLADHINAGGTLADAMTDIGAFPDRLINLVQIGERANRLPEISENIATVLRTEVRNSQQVRQALIYPGILLAMSVLVVLMLIFFLAPTLVPVFRSANAEPPALLASLDTFGTLLRRQWIMAFAVLCGAVLGALVFANTAVTAVTRLIGVLPGCRSYMRARETLRFFQTMHLMLASGAQLPTALSTASDTANNMRWREGLDEIRSKVEAGEPLTVAFRESGLSDESALAFVEAGEESDRMADMLAQGARLLDERTQGQLAQLLRLITPFLTLLIGLTVGLLIFTTIGAILDLNELAA